MPKTSLCQNEQICPNRLCLEILIPRVRTFYRARRIRRNNFPDQRRAEMLPMDKASSSGSNDWNNNTRITGSEKIVVAVTISLALHRLERKKNAGSEAGGAR